MVASGQAIVLPMKQAGKVQGLRVSPVGFVEGSKNMRIIHDMTFEHGGGNGKFHDGLG